MQRFVDAYRPKTLDEVIGQKTAVSKIDGLISSGKAIGNTILISGPYGTGKTTLARIVARTLNCAENGKDPCGKCASCKMSIQAHPDVEEINSADHRGIDDIRRIIDTAAYSPRFRCKVFIMDEVHQMTPQASQSFLKTLEEPPPHTTFILVTTDPHKLLKTILSRATHVKLNGVRDQDVARYVTSLAKSEGISLPKALARMIASSSQGHVRDAVTTLEQVVSSAVSEDNMESFFQEREEQLAAANPWHLAPIYIAGMLSGNLKPLVCVRKSKNVHQLIKHVTDQLRNYIILRMDPDIIEDARANKLRAAVGVKVPEKTLIKILDLHVRFVGEIASPSASVSDMAEVLVLKSVSLVRQCLLNCRS